MLALFVRHEARTAEPMIALDLFRLRSLRTANLASMTGAATLFGMLLVLPFYMTEIVKEVEESYGERLTGWVGEMEKLEGIEKIIRKLIFIKEDRRLDMPVMPGTRLEPAIAAMAIVAATVVAPSPFCATMIGKSRRLTLRIVSLRAK